MDDELKQLIKESVMKLKEVMSVIAKLDSDTRALAINYYFSLMKSLGSISKLVEKDE